MNFQLQNKINALVFQLDIGGNGRLNRDIGGERHETGCRRLLLQEEILRRPECTVHTNNRHTNHERRNKHRPNIRQKHNHDTEDGQNPQNFPLAEPPAIQHQRLCAEKVEKRPTPQQDQEQEEWNKMRKKAEGYNGAEHNHIINAEIGPVFPNSGCCLNEGLGLGESVMIHEFQPWPTMVHCIFNPFWDFGQENSGRRAGK